MNTIIKYENKDNYLFHFYTTEFTDYTCKFNLNSVNNYVLLDNNTIVLNKNNCNNTTINLTVLDSNNDVLYEYEIDDIVDYKNLMFDEFKSSLNLKDISGIRVRNSVNNRFQHYKFPLKCGFIFSRKDELSDNDLTFDSNINKRHDITLFIDENENIIINKLYDEQDNDMIYTTIVSGINVDIKKHVDTELLFRFFVEHVFNNEIYYAYSKDYVTSLITIADSIYNSENFEENYPDDVKDIITRIINAK